MQRLTRLEMMAQNNLGFVVKNNQSGSAFLKMSTKKALLLFRRPELEVLDSYLENRQYAHLQRHTPSNVNEPFDKRLEQPKITFPLIDMCLDQFIPLICSETSRLKFNHKEDQSKTDELNIYLEDELNFWGVIDEFLRSYLSCGSGFLRFWKTDDENIKLTYYKSKFCHPLMDDKGDLLSVEIRYIYDSGEYNDRDEKIYRWHKMLLGRHSDILYDNPDFDPNEETLPVFTESNKIDHNLGLVQGEWIQTNETDTTEVDGRSFFGNNLDFIDSFNYRLSKEDAAVYYSMFPNLTGYGIEKADFERAKLDKFNTLFTHKTPSESALGFLEMSGAGLGISEQFHHRNFTLFQQMLKVAFVDPEQVAGYANSAKSMEMLYRPVIQHVKKIRPCLKKGLKSIVNKILAVSSNENLDDFDCVWGDFFGDTIQDILQKSQTLTTLVQSKIISKKRALINLKDPMSIDDVEEEIREVAKETTEEMENETIQFNATQPALPPKQNAKKPKTDKK